MSITTPILLLNSYAALQGLSRSPENTPEDEDEFHKYFSVSMFLGAVTTIPVVYIPIALGYFLSLTLKLSLIGALITEIAVLIYLYYETKYQKSS